MKHLSKYLADPATIPRRLRWSWDTWRQKGGRETVATWNGLLTFDRADSLIGKGLYVRRSYEKDVIERAMRVLKSHGEQDRSRDTLLDVGANLGMISLAFLRHRYFAHAIAVEPVPENYSLLEHNIRQNNYKNRVVPFQLALSDFEGEVSMRLDPKNRGAHRVMREDETVRVDSSHQVTVPAMTFDRFVDEGHCDPNRLGLIWIDIEGHEARFFLGADKLRSAAVPAVMEFSPRFIRASGIDDERYLQILEHFFDSFCDLRSDSSDTQSTSQLASLLSQYDTPDRISATDLLLFPRH